MPVAVETVKTVIEGQIQGIQDWSTAFWCEVVNAVPVTQPGMNNWADIVAGYISTFWSAGIDSANLPDTVVNSVKAYYYPAGSGVATVQAVHLYGTALPGTATGGGSPTQLAIVHSLRSGVPGRRGRGRMYLPATGLALSSGSHGQLASGACSSFAGALAALFTAVNTSGSFAAQFTSQNVVVRSETGNMCNAVDQIIVDSKIDTQRRREDKIPTQVVAVVDF